MSNLKENIRISSDHRVLDEARQGYLHPSYAQSLSEFGAPRHLPACDAWILERRIPGRDERDAMGCYPLFCCSDWSKLGSDIAGLSDGLVSLTLVTDPFGEYDEELLKASFDFVAPFKQHLVIDCRDENFSSRHHRYYARKALQNIEIEISTRPIDYLQQWSDLYEHLIHRHSLRGIKAFSQGAFALQLQIPDAHLVLARTKEELVGAQLWYLQGEVAYSHLLALTPEGYRTRAAYALYHASIEHLRDRTRWIDLGAGAGADANDDDGLSLFKRGWTDQTRTAHLCGAILNPEAYAKIAHEAGCAGSTYFPAYRHNELV